MNSGNAMFIEFLYIGLALTAVLLVAFILVYRHNKMSLVPGLLFDLLLGSLVLDYYLATLFVFRDNIFFVIGAVILLALALLLLVFGLYALLLFFLLNARAVYRRESRTLANSLTLIAAGALVVFLLVNVLLSRTDPPDWLLVTWGSLLFAVGCFILNAFVFLTSLILCNLARPKPVQDYIIVLGGGLSNGKVTPLLAQRIKRAIDFGKSQLEKTGHQAVLIMSGGQGKDEPRSEAAAMTEYAIETGWLQEHILLEDRSRSTLENLRFSKQIMDERVGEAETNYSCVFATSAYHLLRAGMFARQAGLKIDGLGAKSAWYFVPNATLREYIAYLSVHKRRVLIAFILLFLLGIIAFNVLHWFNSQFVI